jgi:hypothetical protein
MDTDKEIDNLAKSLQYAIENSYAPPSNFYGVGGMKIFHDLIYQMKGMMKADHKFYKAHGQYDFPQKKKGTMLLMYLVGAMLSNKKLKAKLGNAMNDGMIMSHRKVIDDLKKKNRRGFLPRRFFAKNSSRTQVRELNLYSSGS